MSIETHETTDILDEDFEAGDDAYISGDTEDGERDEDTMAGLDALAAREDGPSTCYWEGDRGTLNMAERKTLHLLIKKRYISADKNPAEWAILTATEHTFISRLNDLFFDLQIDRTARVAYKVPATTDTGDSLPRLTQDRAHSKEVTIILLLLRQRYQKAREQGGTRVRIDRTDLLNDIAEMRPSSATNNVRNTALVNKAIDQLLTSEVLSKANRTDPDRFEISPVINVLMPPEKIRVLTRWLEEAAGVPADHDDDPLVTSDHHGSNGEQSLLNLDSTPDSDTANHAQPTGTRPASPSSPAVDDGSWTY